LDVFYHRPGEQEAERLAVAAEPLLELGTRRGRTQPEVALAGGAQGVAESGDDGLHGAPAFDVPGREATDFLFAARVVVPELNAGAVVKRDEEAVAGGHPGVAARGEVQIRDDARV